MSIAEKEEQLFKEWEKIRVPFVRDGVVNEKRYEESPCKVAFVLKEYGDWQEKPHDLRGVELINPYREGWRNVAEILRSINIWRNPAANNDGVPNKMPDNICAFNLMKKRGGKETDWSELAQVAKEDGDFIRRQFAIYDPDVTLCMGYHGQKGDMLDIFRDVMGHTGIPKQHTKMDWGWYERSPGKIVVNTYHMSNHGQQSHEDVIEVVKEISENVQFGR